jgi:hypothetical protein
MIGLHRVVRYNPAADRVQGRDDQVYKKDSQAARAQS